MCQQRYQRAQLKVLKNVKHSKQHKHCRLLWVVAGNLLFVVYGLPASPRSLSIAIMLYWWSLSCKFFTNPAQTKMRNCLEASLGLHMEIEEFFFSLEGLIVRRYWMCAGTGIGAPCCFFFFFSKHRVYVQL